MSKKKESNTPDNMMIQKKNKKKLSAHRSSWKSEDSRIMRLCEKEMGNLKRQRSHQLKMADEMRDMDE